MPHGMVQHTAIGSETFAQWACFCWVMLNSSLDLNLQAGKRDCEGKGSPGGLRLGERGGGRLDRHSHHQEDGATSSLGHVSQGQRAVCTGLSRCQS